MANRAKHRAADHLVADAVLLADAIDFGDELLLLELEATELVRRHVVLSGHSAHRPQIFAHENTPPRPSAFRGILCGMPTNGDGRDGVLFSYMRFSKRGQLWITRKRLKGDSPPLI